ncbi:ferredoxin [Streptomyces sp. NA04227]|nr:ferredoxin [Streptomyces sp. NA04227]QKW11307.1 ferredoxin [Streptomyces sp. NA04227]
MNISIDTGRCVGAGQCARNAPDVFVQNDHGFGTLRTGRGSHPDTTELRDAVHACPVQAISLVLATS